ncbi:hypothetical protein P9H32_15640 [Pontiella sp. NLcol2]|uniref:Uncharacterized protein n=1 Tax=Pontiella agarivorans TaxID=3038953 RepID=A0ABU5N0X5_9BACT|nr:hypothetical protein [Pontiella agarivorans]
MQIAASTLFDSAVAALKQPVPASAKQLYPMDLITKASAGVEISFFQLLEKSGAKEII